MTVESSQEAAQPAAQEEAAEVVEGGEGEEVVVEESEASDEEDELEENEAVVVQWGKGKLWSAVVCTLRREGPRQPRGVKVQFDADHAHAWVARSAVRPMELVDAADLPAWLRPGGALQALDPCSARREWHAATVQEVRRGVEAGEAGLRVWLKYTSSGFCQWLQRSGIRPPRGGADDGGDNSEGGEGGKGVGTAEADGDGDGDGVGDGDGNGASQPTPKSRKRRRAAGSSEQAAAQGVARAAARGQGEIDAIAEIGRLSRPAGEAGCARWLLATKPLPKLGALAVHFGGLPPQPAELIAPNVLACVVPEGPWASASEAAPEAAVPVPLRVTGTNGAGRPFDLRCELQFTLQRCGSG